MPEAVITGGARTAVGRLLGSLKDFTAADLGGLVIRAALERSGLTGADAEYVIMGQVLQAGAGQIPARQAAGAAGPGRRAATPLPAGIDLAAYRIVQEALTNAWRHAPASDVDIEVTYEEGVLRLRVRDQGPGPAEDMMAGHGIVGMRDRATIAGGTFACGAADGGGFAVDVELPTDGEGS